MKFKDLIIITILKKKLSLNQETIHFEEKNKLLKICTINTHNKILKIYLLNNSVYTYYNIDNDKINDNENIVNIFAMHFPKNFYNEESNQRIEKIFNDKVHLVLTGHIHRSHSKTNNSEYNIPMYFTTGQFQNHC